MWWVKREQSDCEQQKERIVQDYDFGDRESLYMVYSARLI